MPRKTFLLLLPWFLFSLSFGADHHCGANEELTTLSCHKIKSNAPKSINNRKVFFRCGGAVRVENRNRTSSMEFCLFLMVWCEVNRGFAENIILTHSLSGTSAKPFDLGMMRTMHIAKGLSAVNTNNSNMDVTVLWQMFSIEIRNVMCKESDEIVGLRFFTN